MSARFSEVQGSAARLLFGGRVPPGHLLQVDERGEWRLEVEAAERASRASASALSTTATATATTTDGAEAVRPVPVRRWDRWNAARVGGAAGLVVALLAWGVVGARWRGRLHDSPADGRPGTDWAASPLAPGTAASGGDWRPGHPPSAPVVLPNEPGGGSPGLDAGASPAQGSTDVAEQPPAGGASVVSVPEIVPPQVLGRVHVRSMRAKAPAGGAKRARRVEPLRASGADEREDTAVLNEGPLPAVTAAAMAIDRLGASAPALANASQPSGMAHRIDRLVALPDVKTAIVTDPTDRLPRAVAVGGLLPSGARLLSVDPRRGLAMTDRGALELR